MTHEPTPAQIAAWTEYIRALAAHAVKNVAQPSEDKVNAYADAMIRRDKLHRDDGRPEDDRDTGWRRI